MPWTPHRTRPPSGPASAAVTSTSRSIAFGVLGDQTRFDEDPEAAADAAHVNYVGVVSSGLAVAKAMRKQGHGTIVVLSSVAGERARKSNFVYGSTKSATDAFAQGLGDSLVGTGVRVMVVRPGFVHSKMTAGMESAPFATTPDAVADAIIEGLASGKEIVWVPPLLRWMMAGFRHLPRGAWRRVSASRRTSRTARSRTLTPMVREEVELRDLGPDEPERSLASALIRTARPRQWTKNVPGLRRAGRRRRAVARHPVAPDDHRVRLLLPRRQRVEGIGGIMVPLTNSYLLGDFVKLLGLQLIVVSRPNLGSVNHTLLTVNHVRI